jgi:hypothetical protein
MFFCWFLDSNMFVYDTMTFWDKKNMLYKPKMIFFSLTEAAFAGKLLGFLGMFLKRTLPYPLDLDHIWSISWEEHQFFFVFDLFCSIIF